EVRAPVALHQTVVAGVAHGGEEARFGAGLHDDVDVVRAQQVFKLLLDQLALIGPVGGGGVVAHENLHREGAAGLGQLGHGLFLVLKRQIGVEGLAVGVLVKAAVVGVVLGGGGKGQRGDGVVQKALGVGRVVHLHGVDAVEAVHDGEA